MTRSWAILFQGEQPPSPEAADVENMLRSNDDKIILKASKSGPGHVVHFPIRVAKG